MILVEALAATLLGLVVLWLVLRPLVQPGGASDAPVFEPIDPEETPKGIALAALKEIEFDRETGKLSDADYELLKRKYTAAALDAMRNEDEGADAPRAARSGSAVGSPATCSMCGPRPEPDAVFCSSCGRRLTRLVAA